MENSGLYITTARLRAREGKAEELKEILRQTIKDCATHEGLLLYSVQQNAADPHEFLFYEHFASEEALRAHLDTPEIAKALKAFTGVVDEESRSLETWKYIEATGGFTCP